MPLCTVPKHYLRIHLSIPCPFGCKISGLRIGEITGWQVYQLLLALKSSERSLLRRTWEKEQSNMRICLANNWKVDIEITVPTQWIPFGLAYVFLLMSASLQISKEAYNVSRGISVRREPSFHYTFSHTQMSPVPYVRNYMEQFFLTLFSSSKRPVISLPHSKVKLERVSQEQQR
jgi:hypothetical protein